MIMRYPVATLNRDSCLRLQKICKSHCVRPHRIDANPDYGRTLLRQGVAY